MAMRISDFWANVDDAFGSARGRSLAADMSLSALGSRTAKEAIDQGERPQTVWDALCEQMDLPEHMHHLHLIAPEER